MSRIPTPAPTSATGATAEVYAQIKKAVGNVPNTFAAIGAHGPAALKAILQAEGVLAASTLSKQDQETIKLIVSEVAGCDYCVAAHSMLGKLAGLNGARVPVRLPKCSLIMWSNPLAGSGLGALRI